uniref:Uncharacterized protein n=1 Tax=Anguilla anguilla TaxID=7936 RepID=A0A0E9WFW8_ANGAN
MYDNVIPNSWLGNFSCLSQTPFLLCLFSL